MSDLIEVQVMPQQAEPSAEAQEVSPSEREVNKAADTLGIGKKHKNHMADPHLCKRVDAMVAIGMYIKANRGKMLPMALATATYCGEKLQQLLAEYQRVIDEPEWSERAKMEALSAKSKALGIVVTLIREQRKLIDELKTDKHRKVAVPLVVFGNEVVPPPEVAKLMQSNGEQNEEPKATAG